MVINIMVFIINTLRHLYRTNKQIGLEKNNNAAQISSGLRKWEVSHLFLSSFGFSPRHEEMSHDSVCEHSSPL